MALADFIQSLQEQDTVYSTPPQPSIRVIPPENQSIKVIPPETIAAEQPAPKVIKLKIKPKIEQPVAQPQVIVNNTQNVVVSQTPNTTEKPKPILQPVSKPNTNNTSSATITQQQEDIPKYVPNDVPTQKPNPKPVVNEQPQTRIVVEKTQITDEDIFNSTGTEYSKKQIWLDYFEKAKNSRKSNPIVDRMRVGRFTITPDNKVLLLPDYDIVGKDPDDVLKDKWF